MEEGAGEELEKKQTLRHFPTPALSQLRPIHEVFSFAQEEGGESGDP